MESLYSLPVVLIIARDPRKINFIKRLLKKEFYILDTAESASALEWISHTAIDLIIIDEKEIPFLELCRKIRSRSDYQTIPILLISNNLKKSFISQALAVGVNDFLNEPLEEQEVIQRLAVVEKAHQTEKKLKGVAARLQRVSTVERKKMPARLIISNTLLKELMRVSKKKHPLSFLVIQIDRFSEIVRKWGPVTRKEIASQMTTLLSHIKRSDDLLFPQKKGQYFLLLPLTSQKDAEEFAHKIKKHVASAIFVTAKKDLLLTVTIHCGSFSEKGEFDRLSDLSKSLSAVFLSPEVKGSTSQTRQPFSRELDFETRAKRKIKKEPL
jgi:two-component system, cell cycle response regulator